MPSGSTGKSALQLKALLAAAGLDAKHARKNVQHALSTAQLLKTSAFIERTASAAVRSMKGGAPTSPEQVTKDVAAREGLRGLLALVESLRVQVRGDVDGVAYVQQVRLRAIEYAAAFVPHTTREAVDKMSVVQGLASLGKWTAHSYSSFFNFSNEPGLPAAAAALPVRGGVVTGVSGGVLEIATAVHADAVVLTDVDPKLAEWMTFFAALLLVVDDEAQREGYGDDVRANRVRDLMTNNGAAVQLFADAGMLDVARLVTRREVGAWRNHKTWIDTAAAPANIAHLTMLARQGKLLAIDADLADAELHGRLAAIVRGLNLPVSVVNYSNALDYIADTDAAIGTFEGLPLAPNAQVMATTDRGHAPEVTNTPVGQLLGSFESPKFAPHAQWSTDGYAKRIIGAFPRTNRHTEAMRGLLHKPEAVRAVHKVTDSPRIQGADDAAATTAGGWKQLVQNRIEMLDLKARMLDAAGGPYDEKLSSFLAVYGEPDALDDVADIDAAIVAFEASLTNRASLTRRARRLWDKLSHSKEAVDAKAFAPYVDVARDFRSLEVLVYLACTQLNAQAAKP